MNDEKRTYQKLDAGILILALAGCAGAEEKTGTYVTNGVVTLTGTAATTPESNRTAEIARGVAGVKDVKNEFRVQ